MINQLPTEVDQTLVARVKQYMDNAGLCGYVELDELSNYLRVKHVEYRRLKKVPFRLQVQRAYECVVRVWRHEYASSSDTESEHGSNLATVQVSIDNAINNSITEMYSRSNGGKSSDAATVGSTDQTASSLAPESGNTDADGGCQVVVDRIGDGSEQPERTTSIKPPADHTPTKRKHSKRIGKRKETEREDEENEHKKHKTFSCDKPSCDLSDFGGNETSVSAVCDILEDFIDTQLLARIGPGAVTSAENGDGPVTAGGAGLVLSRGLLLYGPPGSGKSLLARCVAGELHLPLISCCSTELVSGVSGDSEQLIRQLFNTARRAAPCVLFVDEIDALTAKRETAHREMERRIVSQLLACFDQLAAECGPAAGSSGGGAPVLVVGAANHPDHIDAALRRAKRFDHEVTLGIPDAVGRANILNVLTRRVTLASDVDLSQVALMSPGFVGADLYALVTDAQRAARQRVRNQADADLLAADSVVMDTSEHRGHSITDDAHARLSTRRASLSRRITLLREPCLSPASVTAVAAYQLAAVTAADFSAALERVQPSALREGFASVPDVRWSDVGALASIRRELHSSILDRVRDPDYYQRLGLTAASGVLICGPPGCGKTLVAKAVANEAGVNFLSVKGPEIFNMYVGESERAVRQLFLRARNSAPCVIFFDEIDSVCQRRGDGGEGGSSARVVNQLLTEMDGLGGRGGGVYLMAATNRPDIIDPAILRPGRIDKLLYVGVPGVEGRADILRAVTRSGQRPRLAADVDLGRVAGDQRCAGLTGADLASVVREAAELTARDRLEEVSWRHLDAALNRVRPSVSVEQQRFYEKTRRGCANHADDECEDV